MRLSQINKTVLDEAAADRLLFLWQRTDAAAEEADVILVPGSRKAAEYRIPLAAELYHKGAAAKLVLSGGKVQDTSLGKTEEYRAMLAAARKLGVPREDILCEKRALDTSQNLKYSARLIEEQLPGCKRVILVTAAYHMRRTLLLAQRLMPQFEITPAAADVGSAASGVWKKTEKGRRTVFDECMKLGWYAREGLVDDIDF